MKKHHKRTLVIIIFLLSGVLGLVVSWYQHPNIVLAPQPADAQMMQTFHSPAMFVKQIVGDPDAGRKIFKEFCAACHDKEPVIDVNAPRIGDKKAWESRRKWGIPQLLKMTITGVGAMPARGGCFECSDEQLEKALHYILEQK